MRLEVRLFAALRQRAGQDSVAIELADGATVGDALESLAAQHPALAQAMVKTRLVMAVNREYATAETVLCGQDELALIPPVSGGEAKEHLHVSVHEGTIDRERMVRAVSSDHTGAIVTFEGVTRDVERLEYEAYMPMAQERIEEILHSAMDAHDIEGVAAEHRVGAVPLGEPSVVVVAAAAHRGEAFAAARDAIDRIKAEAPIWKQEVDGESARWVKGVPPPAG